MWATARRGSRTGARGVMLRQGTLSDLGDTARQSQLPRLHVARGWRQRPCPKCTSLPGEPCRTPSGHEAAAAHAARLSPGGFELPSWELVWAELERCGASIALVPFHGRARAGGRVGKITLSRPIATPTSPDSRRSTARSSGPPRPSRRNHRSAGVRAIRRGRVLICQRPVSWREAGWRRNRNTEPSASAAAANPGATATACAAKTSTRGGCPPLTSRSRLVELRGDRAGRVMGHRRG